MKLFPASDGEAYRTLARAWAATVNVVTARQRGGTLPPGVLELDGFTATGFLTVSIDPPIILVSCTNAATSLAMLSDAEAFAVNLLAPHQDELAQAFARTHEERPDAWKRFAWKPDSQGVPLFDGVVGAFSARVRAKIPAGDHTLILGDVTELHVAEPAGAESLVYHNRGYRRFAPARLP
jgi:flavin reductase (DIM6/NTAB) family NADH-FMN oxidoreductase RutF